MGQFAAYEAVLPDLDEYGIRFHETWLTVQIRRLYIRVATSFPVASLALRVLAGVALVALAAAAWLANKVAARHDAIAFTPNWTSVILEIEVVRKDICPFQCLSAARTAHEGG